MEAKGFQNPFSRGEGGPEGVGRGMRAITFDTRKREGLLLSRNPGLGL